MSGTHQISAYLHWFEDKFHDKFSIVLLTLSENNCHKVLYEWHSFKWVALVKALLTSIDLRTSSAINFRSSSWLSPRRAVAQSFTSMTCSLSSFATTASKEQMSKPPYIKDTWKIKGFFWKHAFFRNWFLQIVSILWIQNFCGILWYWTVFALYDLLLSCMALCCLVKPYVTSYGLVAFHSHGHVWPHST